MKLTPLILSLSVATATAQEAIPLPADPPAPASPTQQVVAKPQTPARPQYSPQDTKKIESALDELPNGKYIGKLPDDLYLQLAHGKEGEHALKLLQKWENEGLNPLLKFNGKLQYTYGSGTPLIIVKPVELTDIEFQEGEQINDILIGDNIRWSISPTVSGTNKGQSQISHIIVKAKQPNLTTSLIVTTDRRTYRFRLISSSVFHIPHAAFNYPAYEQELKNDAYREELKKLEAQREDLADTVKYSQSQRIAELEKQLAKKEHTAKRLADPLYLDFLYKIKRTKGRPDWSPVNCYNDGQKTYIVMPRGMQHSEAPILLLSDGKHKEMVNYRLVDNKFVVDRIFSKAILVSGVGFNRKEVLISRTNR